jgi:hypothetical protein
MWRMSTTEENLKSYSEELQSLYKKRLLSSKEGARWSSSWAGIWEHKPVLLWLIKAEGKVELEVVDL